MLEGRCWVVVRSLGSFQRDVVVKSGSLDEALAEHVSPTGIALLRQAISRAILGDAARLMPPKISEAHAWEIALAWATRDQECRFSHQLDWRDPISDSHSPARRFSRDDHLVAARALLGALSPDELDARQREEGEAEQLTTIRSGFDRLNWHIDRTRSALVAVLGDLGGSDTSSDLELAAFKAAAADRFATILQLPADAYALDLERARRDCDATRDELRGLEDALKEISIRIDEKTQSLTLVRSELPSAAALLVKEENPICPICRVPIDKILARGCGISTETCDLESLQARITKLREEIDRQQKEIASLQAKSPGLENNIAIVSQRFDALNRTVARLERALLDRSASVREAQRLIEDVERYQGLLDERARTKQSLDQMEQEIAITRETLVAHRGSVAETVHHLSALFDAVLRELVPGEIKGEAKLDGNGLALKIEMGGERTTAAIESVKVIAFDIAAVAMTIEGRTHLPGFLIHDSPREADLGFSIYRRLFDLARRLEGFGPSPLFQYIVTTTTEPPVDARSEPWLRLTIRGAPAEHRLLRVDL
jgi:septal ring factor EnvC (AmiA/AmiB activator)